MGFSRQEYWSGVPLPSPGDLPYPGIEPRSPALWADALSSKPPGKPKLILSITSEQPLVVLLSHWSMLEWAPPPTEQLLGVQLTNDWQSGDHQVESKKRLC